MYEIDPTLAERGTKGLLTSKANTTTTTTTHYYYYYYDYYYQVPQRLYMLVVTQNAATYHKAAIMLLAIVSWVKWRVAPTEQLGRVCHRRKLSSTPSKRRSM